MIYAVSLYIEGTGGTFDAVHLYGVENVAGQKKRDGVVRLVHVPRLGADANSDSSYFRARFRELIFQFAGQHHSVYSCVSVVWGRRYSAAARFLVFGTVCRKIPVDRLLA